MTGRLPIWLVAMAAMLAACILPAAAQETAWTVAKTSGEAWVGSTSQPASLSQQTQLRPGDSIRTGRNGRVLLVRGQETILLSPNSAISLPEAGRAGLSTVIQQAGTILLDVEKRNVQHFEVETPYLAAVVKGTRFRVSIVGGQTKVDVVRGQVQVTDFRSGDYALVNPQQSARSAKGAAGGLRLGGSGQLDAVQRGAPQTPRVQPLQIPAGGLKPDAGAIPLRQAPTSQSASASGAAEPAVQRTAGGGTRIVAPIGEVRLDISQVTNGMARNTAESAGRGSSQSWSARLQPNSNNVTRTDNSGTTIAPPSDSGSVRTGNGLAGNAAPQSGGVVTSAAFGVFGAAGLNAAPPAVTGGGQGSPGNTNAGPVGKGQSDGTGDPIGKAPASGPGDLGSSGTGTGQAGRIGKVPASGAGDLGKTGPDVASGGSGKSPGGSGSNSGSGGGLLGLIGKAADDLGLGNLVPLIDNRGRGQGNRYGLIGGNGVGKALGLGKKP